MGQDNNQFTTPGDHSVEGGGANTQTHIQWLLKSNDSLRDDLRRIENKIDSHAEIFREQARINGELQANMKTLISAVEKQDDVLKQVEKTVGGFKAFTAGAVAVVGVVLPSIWVVWGDRLVVWIKSIL